nr:MAG TPA_asm: hypothetical protein [Caudoviricetes sp.]
MSAFSASSVINLTSSDIFTSQLNVPSKSAAFMMISSLMRILTVLPK